MRVALNDCKRLHEDVEDGLLSLIGRFQHIDVSGEQGLGRHERDEFFAEADRLDANAVLRSASDAARGSIELGGSLFEPPEDDRGDVHIDSIGRSGMKL